MNCPTRDQKILVIDDDDGIRTSLEAMLTLSGFRALVAADASQAFVAMAHSWPDLILVDSNLPTLSGEQTVTAIRRLNSDIPIIGFSAEDRRWSMMEAGATAFLEKPFEPDSLLANIDHLLGLSV